MIVKRGVLPWGRSVHNVFKWNAQKWRWCLRMTDWLTDWLTDRPTDSMKQSPSEKLRVTQLVKKFPTFYGTRKFIIVSTRPPPLAPLLSQMHPVHTFPPHFPKLSLCVFKLSTTPWKRTGGVEVHHEFLTSALDGGELSASRSSRFTPGQEPLDRRLGGP
jgi:hypothetical protein